MQNYNIIVDGKLYESFSEAVDAVADNVDDSYYDEWLDELGEVHIGSLSYRASAVLKSVDPVAYRCGRTDFDDYIRDSVEDTLKDVVDTDIYGVEVKFEWKDEADEEEDADDE